MRPEQELDLLNVEALVDTDGAEHYDVLAHALRLFPADQRAPIVAALVRWRKAREGLDDGYFPTVRALRRWVQVCERRAMKHERDARKYTSSSYGPDAAELHKLLAVWGNDITFGDNNLDDDTDDDGLDDDTDDEGLDDDTDDEGLDDDEHGDTVTTYREPTGEGVSLVVTYDPSADDFTLDGVSVDDGGLDDDTDDEGLDDDTDDEGLDDDTDDEVLDDDTDDDGLDDDGLDDDDDHGADCFCGACCEAQVVGLATVAGDDPGAYLARSGAGDLATIGREVLDDEGLDDDDNPDGPLWRDLAVRVERIEGEINDEGLDDEGLDGQLWRQLAEEERIDRAPLTPEEIEARIEGEINDELRGLAALGLTPLQWVGAFSKCWDYDTTPPLYWHTGGMQRLEMLAELRAWVVANHDTDALTISGAAVVTGGDAQPTIYDAIRWESAWAALRPLRLEEKGGATQERRRWFDALGLIDPPPGAFVGFCDLLGEWSAEIAAAFYGGFRDRPTSPTLKGWLARTDAALLTRELARVQPGHAEGRVALWRSWGRFIGDAWAIKEGLTWAGPISKGGE